MRPIVKAVSNGGHLTIKLNEAIEFPSDMLNQLNTKKEELIVMQVAPENDKPTPFSDSDRGKLPDLVSWEALSA